MDSGISKIASFMNIIKSKGPSVEPCGTPVVTGHTSHIVKARTYMHWTAVSAARGASRAAELAAKVTSAQDVLPTSGLLATAMEMPNIDRILAVNITV